MRGLPSGRGLALRWVLLLAVGCSTGPEVGTALRLEYALDSSREVSRKSGGFFTPVSTTEVEFEPDIVGLGVEWGDPEKLTAGLAYRQIDDGFRATGEFEVAARMYLGSEGPVWGFLQVGVGLHEPPEWIDNAWVFGLGLGGGVAWRPADHVQLELMARLTFADRDSGILGYDDTSIRGTDILFGAAFWF